MSSRSLDIARHQRGELQSAAEQLAHDSCADASGAAERGDAINHAIEEFTTGDGQPLLLVALAADLKAQHVAVVVASRYGIEDLKTRQKLSIAIETAIRGHRPSLVLWRRLGAKRGNLIQVRPAREAGAAVITMSEIGAPARSIDPAILIELFELTQAEAEITVEFFQNLDLADIAASRRVQLETVRGQVKNVLRKAGVASQKELLVLLSKIAFAESAAAERTDRAAAGHAKKGGRR